MIDADVLSAETTPLTPRQLSLTENPRGKDGREIDSHSEASIEKEPNVVFDLEMKRVSLLKRRGGRNIIIIIIILLRPKRFDFLLSLMEFINFQTGREGKARLYQDNTSAIRRTVNHLLTRLIT